MSVMKKAMDTGEQQGEFINKMLETSGPAQVQQAAHPYKGASVDLSL